MPHTHDPPRGGSLDAPDHEHPPGTYPHPHPHPVGGEGGRPRIGFVGAGRVGMGLAIALSRIAWPVSAVASRDPERRAAFRRAVPSAVELVDAASVVDAADVIFVTVPDDAIPAVVASIRLYSGQGIVHTSGALSADVLAPALAAGSASASFHPLVAFADPARAAGDLPGATVAIEGESSLVALLVSVAEALGAQPVRLPPGGKAAYHAAAVLAAGGFVGLLDVIAELARGAGLDRALTGPIVRGDVGTLRSHLEAIDRLAPSVRELYVAAARREIAIAERRGEPDGARRDALEAVLDEAR
jgi:predicted short-subunit dehydrogenase-like oxidoreductase (DUF2520 family)